MLLSDEHPEKVKSSIFRNPRGRLIAFSPVHLAKAPPSIVVMLFGTVTRVNEGIRENKSSPRAVTGTPPSTEGMMTSLKLSTGTTRLIVAQTLSHVYSKIQGPRLSC